jgi:hypothetical protein
MRKEKREKRKEEREGKNKRRKIGHFSKSGNFWEEK